MVEERPTCQVGIHYRVAIGQHANDFEIPLSAITPDSLLVLGVADFIGDDVDLFDSQFECKGYGSPGGFQGTIVGFGYNQEMVNVANGATGEVFDRGFHIDDGVLVRLLDELPQHTTHGGMGGTESTFTGVIYPGGEQESNIVGSHHAVFRGNCFYGLGQDSLLDAFRIRAFLNN